MKMQIQADTPGIGRRLRRGGRNLLCLAGLAFLTLLALAFTTLPGRLTRWLGAPPFKLVTAPRYLVVLGGGGIPSESGLIRTYYAASIGTNLVDCTFIVSLPADQDPEQSSVGRMKRELVLRGIPAAAILMEHRGRNTHEQAAAIRAMLPPAAAAEPVLLVTSPYHMRRSVLCFRREGFQQVAGVIARSVGPEAYLGLAIPLRYLFWANLQAEVDATREICAMLYYQIRGWI